MLMERYDYESVICEDIRNYISENEIVVTYDNMDDLQDELYDKLFCEDSVTGNASGSYTFNTWDAEENICHNMHLLQDACDEFGCTPKFDCAEWCDVTIRCYLLGSCLSQVLDELADEYEESHDYSMDGDR